MEMSKTFYWLYDITLIWSTIIYDGRNQYNGLINLDSTSNSA